MKLALRTALWAIAILCLTLLALRAAMDMSAVPDATARLTRSHFDCTLWLSVVVSVAALAIATPETRP